MNNQSKIYLLTLLSFLVGTSQFIIAGILDKIASSLDITVASAGQLVTVFALASAIGTPILTVILSRYSLKTQLLIAISIFLVGAFLTPLNLGYEVLVLARAITGVGTILFVVTAYVFAGRLSGEGKQGSGMSYIALGFSLSQVAGVPLGRMIANLYNWQMIFYIVGFLVLLGTFIIIATFQKRTPQIPPTIKEQVNILKDKKVFLALSVTVFTFITFSAITTFITPLIFSIEKVSEHTITMIFIILGVASVIGSKTGSSLADKIGVQKVLLSTMSIVVLSLVIMNIFSHSFIVFVAMLTIWNITIWMFGPTQTLNLSTIFPTHSSVLISLNSSFVQLGFALGAFFGGVSIEYFDIHSIMILGVLSTLIGFGIYLFTIKQKGN
jgi:MFS transporter, DHA1 family, putative efflux transporter